MRKAENLLAGLAAFDQAIPHFFEGIAIHRNDGNDGRDRFASLLAQMGQAGITRLHSITGFSPLGFPVWNATRPNGKCLSAASGKGPNHFSAALGALMEGIEVAAAEEFQDVDVAGVSFNEMRQRSERVIPQQVTPVITELFSRDVPLDWCCMDNILNPGEQWMVPVNMVALDFRRHCINPMFSNTSNGLASGFNKTEATVQGLMEVVERHSSTCSELLGQIKRPVFASPSAWVREMLAALERHGRQVFIFDETVFDGLPTIRVELATQLGQSHDNAVGWGCHLDIEVALLRAVLEANQAATIILSGSRDDINKDVYLSGKLNFQTRSVREERYQSLPEIVHAGPATSDRASLSSHLPEVLRMLKAAGITAVLTRELNSPCEGTSVVKTIVPGLEGYLAPTYYKAVLHHSALTSIPGRDSRPRSLNAGGAA
jgi:ribosomal protein S12 methylthiotransferase accessory factor